MFITGKRLAQYFEQLKKFNKENLGITHLENENKPFFYITFSKDDQIEVLQGIHVFKYFKRNWHPKFSEQSQHPVDNQVQLF